MNGSYIRKSKIRVYSFLDIRPNNMIISQLQYMYFTVTIYAMLNLRVYS